MANTTSQTTSTCNVESVRKITELFSDYVFRFYGNDRAKFHADTTGCYHFACGDWSGYNLTLVKFLDHLFVNDYVDGSDFIWAIDQSMYNYLSGELMAHVQNRPSCLLG